MTMKFVNPFGPLALSADDATRLGDIARVFVTDSMRRYERHVGQERRQLDERQWRLVKQRESVRVYAEHSIEARRASGAAIESSLPARKDANTKQQDDVMPAPVPPPDLPALLVVGTVEGTLDDAMYGVMNPTLDAMRIKSSYVEDNVVNAAVLATLVEPTAQDPFHSLTLKWMENGQPAYVRPLVKNRDFVYLEATGMATLSNGERVGYHLLHSISFAQMPELDNRVRGSMSVCGIYRQHTYNTVDVYVRAILAPGGQIKRSLVVKSAADALISAWKIVDCGRRKKIAWLIKTRRGASTQAVEKLLSSSRSGSEQLAPVLSEVEPETCISCRVPARGVSFGSSSGTANHKHRCRLCLHYVCNSCRVKKQLSFLAVDGRLLQPGLRFCAACVSDSQEANALAVAKEELSLGDRFTDPRMYLSPESSGYSERFTTWLES